jgi:hypothetical protein
MQFRIKWLPRIEFFVLPTVAVAKARNDDKGVTYHAISLIWMYFHAGVAWATEK